MISFSFHALPFFDDYDDNDDDVWKESGRERKVAKLSLNEFNGILNL
jgi:hypothetical protein